MNEKTEKMTIEERVKSVMLVFDHLEKVIESLYNTCEKIMAEIPEELKNAETNQVE